MEQTTTHDDGEERIMTHDEAVRCSTITRLRDRVIRAQRDAARAALDVSDRTPNRGTTYERLALIAGLLVTVPTHFSGPGNAWDVLELLATQTTVLRAAVAAERHSGYDVHDEASEEAEDALATLKRAILALETALTA